MLTIFASIVGFIGSIIPEILKFLKDRSDKHHALSILEKHSENLHSTNLLKQLNLELEERKIINETILDTKIKWLDALNASVRPLLAYGFFIMYCTMKYIEYKLISQHIAPEIFEVWNENDQVIFAGIISFYFGQRTFNRSKPK